MMCKSAAMLISLFILSIGCGGGPSADSPQVQPPTVIIQAPSGINAKILPNGWLISWVNNGPLANHLEVWASSVSETNPGIKLTTLSPNENSFEWTVPSDSPMFITVRAAENQDGTKYKSSGSISLGPPQNSISASITVSHLDLPIGTPTRANNGTWFFGDLIYNGAFGCLLPNSNGWVSKIFPITAYTVLPVPDLQLNSNNLPILTYGVQLPGTTYPNNWYDIRIQTMNADGSWAERPLGHGEIVSLTEGSLFRHLLSNQDRSLIYWRGGNQEFPWGFTEYSYITNQGGAWSSPLSLWLPDTLGLINHNPNGLTATAGKNGTFYLGAIKYNESNATFVGTYPLDGQISWEAIPQPKNDVVYDSVNIFPGGPDEIPTAILKEMNDFQTLYISEKINGNWSFPIPLDTHVPIGTRASTIYKQSNDGRIQAIITVTDDSKGIWSLYTTFRVDRGIWKTCMLGSGPFMGELYPVSMEDGSLLILSAIGAADSQSIPHVQYSGYLIKSGP